MEHAFKPGTFSDPGEPFTTACGLELGFTPPRPGVDTEGWGVTTDLSKVTCPGCQSVLPGFDELTIARITPVPSDVKLFGHVNLGERQLDATLTSGRLKAGEYVDVGTPDGSREGSIGTLLDAIEAVKCETPGCPHFEGFEKLKHAKANFLDWIEHMKAIGEARSTLSNAAQGRIIYAIAGDLGVELGDLLLTLTPDIPNIVEILEAIAEEWYPET